MDPNQAPPAAMATMEAWCNWFLTWVGFGTIVGLMAKAIMPGRDPGGTVVTLLMGIVGTIIGCGTVSYFCPQYHITPISVIGFGCGTVGAFIILGFYRMLGGYWTAAHRDVLPTPHYRRRRRTVEVQNHPYDDGGSLEL
jgi:uncharacterized membrane protein YeaQ/YmgE (transglycosylase-associated protein family)